MGGTLIQVSLGGEHLGGTLIGDINSVPTSVGGTFADIFVWGGGSEARENRKCPWDINYERPLTEQTLVRVTCRSIAS